MNTHEDRLKIEDTARGGKLARSGRKQVRRYSNKKADRFKKAQAKRG